VFFLTTELHKRLVNGFGFDNLGQVVVENNQPFISGARQAESGEGKKDYQNKGFHKFLEAAAVTITIPAAAVEKER
jgi:hypothetical protein